MIAGGIVLSIFGVISALNASIEDRSARFGAGALCLGHWYGGLVLDHVARGLTISDIPQAFLIAVVALVK